MNSTLYLTRNGLLEPLGQSQVLAYLRGLSREYKIILITYEKADDWADTLRVDRLTAECEMLGIVWLPQRFRAQPKVLAPALSMLRMVWLVIIVARMHGVVLIHARSYIPATVALLVGRLTGLPFIFDMRALWPEELITAGRLRRGSLLYRLIVEAERLCLLRSAGVVSLTHAAVEHLLRVYPKEMVEQNVEVIPTCADLKRFVPATQPPTKLVIGCLGTMLSGWFQIDWLSSFVAFAAKQDPQLRFELTTRDNPNSVRAALGANHALQSRLSIAPCASDKVHEVLQGQLASVMFFTEGIGKLGSSPTRMGEVLGCGLPVIANDGVGDVAHIIRKYRVGVLVSGPSERDMAYAWDVLQQLLADPDLPSRCRKAAEEVFSLEAGTAAYAKLYDRILKNTSSKK